MFHHLYELVHVFLIGIANIPNTRRWRWFSIERLARFPGRVGNIMNDCINNVARDAGAIRPISDELAQDIRHGFLEVAAITFSRRVPTMHRKLFANSKGTRYDLLVSLLCATWQLLTLPRFTQLLLELRVPFLQFESSVGSTCRSSKNSFLVPSAAPTF